MARRQETVLFKSDRSSGGVWCVDSVVRRPAIHHRLPEGTEPDGGLQGVQESPRHVAYSRLARLAGWVPLRSGEARTDLHLLPRPGVSTDQPDDEGCAGRMQRIRLSATPVR